MSHILLVGLGGALGAIARYGIDRIALIQVGSTVIGTLFVNISGSFLLGLLTGILISNSGWSESTRIFFAVGFLGSYTTFSTLSLATVQALEKGDLQVAILNITGSVILGLSAAFIGILIGNMI